MFFTNIIEIIKNEQYVLWLVISALVIFWGTFFYYSYLVIGLRRFRKLLKNTLIKEDTTGRRLLTLESDLKKARIIPRVLKKSWGRFYNEYNSRKDGIIPDTYDYFTEDQIVNKAGLRKIIDIIPAIYVSLGILGTFWGITSGISEIDSQSDSLGMQEGINTLLAGMKFAFYSSIAGIVISLIYQLLDKMLFYRMLTNELDQLLYDLDMTIPIMTESSLLDKLVKTQQEQLNDIKSFFADEFISNLTTGISESISNALNPHLEKSNEIMEKVAQNTVDAQSDTLNEMANHFLQSLNEVTGDQMKRLGESLDKTVEWQEKVHGEMSSLVEELSHVAEQQAEMAKNTTDLSEKMNNYTITLADYQEKLISSTHELNLVTEKNTNVLEQMRSLSEEINERHQQSEDLFSERINQMTDTIARITKLGTVINDLQEETKLTVETLIDATVSMDKHVENNASLNESLIDQHEKSNQWSIETQSLLSDLVHSSEINESIHQNMESLFEKITEERQLFDNKKDEYTNLLETNVAELKQFWNDNKEQLTNNHEQFSALNNSLSQSMDEFTDHMQRGVQQTFEHFDKELKNAVQYLARGVGGIQELVVSMEQDIDSVGGQISRFNQSIEKLNTKVEA